MPIDLRRACLVSCALFVAACGTSSGTGSASGDDDPLTIEDIGAIDADEDAASDGAEPFDTEDDEEMPVLGGDTGDPCIDDEDCESFLCVDLVADDSDEGFCSQACTDDGECPRGFDCVFVATSGGDAEQICLPIDLCVDLDTDGFGIGPGCEGPDCADDNAAMNPRADEVCDGADNNCDGEIDDNPSDANQDCDTGFDGVCAEGRTTCGAGFLTCEGRVPPTDEICDARDNDCDGDVDEDAFGAPLSRGCYDGPGDTRGVGLCSGGFQSCSDGGFTGCLGQVLPAEERCNGEDDDCDGVADEGLAGDIYFPDFDGDGFGDPDGDSVESCAAPVNHAPNALDCDDTDATVAPDRGEELGDGVDQDCDGFELCYADLDRDGWHAGESAPSTDLDCEDPGELGPDGPATDCDDDEAAAFPDNPEICDGIDNDCDERVDEGAGCYDLDDACEDDTDCASGLCRDGFCVDPRACSTPGTCPDRVGTVAGGGLRTSPGYRLQITVGDPIVGARRESLNYELTIGVGASRTGP